MRLRASSFRASQVPLKNKLRRSEAPSALSPWTVSAIAVELVAIQRSVFWNMECRVGKEEGFALALESLTVSAVLWRWYPII